MPCWRQELRSRLLSGPNSACCPGEVDLGYGTLFVSAALDQSIPVAAISLWRKQLMTELPVYSVTSSLTPSGIDLGSRDFALVKKPKVLMLTGAGTSQYATGELWHLLDTRVKMPITMVDTERLSFVRLGEYTHLLLTDKLTDASDIHSIGQFVEKGGIVWAQGAGTLEWLDKAELADISWRESAAVIKGRELKAAQKDKAPAKKIEALLPDRKTFASAREDAALKLVRGAILEGNVDITHPLGYGYSSKFLQCFAARLSLWLEHPTLILRRSSMQKSPLLSGYMSDENRTLASESANQ